MQRRGGDAVTRAARLRSFEVRMKRIKAEAGLGLADAPGFALLAGGIQSAHMRLDGIEGAPAADLALVDTALDVIEGQLLALERTHIRSN